MKRGRQSPERRGSDGRARGAGTAATPSGRGIFRSVVSRPGSHRHGGRAEADGPGTSASWSSRPRRLRAGRRLASNGHETAKVSGHHPATNRVTSADGLASPPAGWGRGAAAWDGPAASARQHRLAAAALQDAGRPPATAGGKRVEEL